MTRDFDFRRLRLSGAIRDVLGRLEASSWEPDTADVASFIDALLKRGLEESEQETAGWFTQSVERRSSVPVGDRLLPSTPNRPARVSPGLQSAFEDALRLRERTGGQDDYIGLRHVLFSILSSRDTATRRELDHALERASDLVARDLAGETAGLILKVREDEESESVWIEIFEERSIQPVEPSTERSSRYIALLNADDPLGPFKDALNSQQEANAFAMTAAAVDMSPPLAVGVFGKWGSGKSTFMHMVHAAVSDIAKKASQSSSREEKPAFHDLIVQVRFNAWHYAETNLWASLLDNIFSALDRWYTQTTGVESEAEFAKLSTARRLNREAVQMLVERRRERLAADAAAQAAEVKLIEARAAATVAPKTLWKAAQLNFDAAPEVAPKKEEIAKAMGALGVGSARTDAAELHRAYRSLRSQPGRSALLRTGLLRNLGSAPALALVFAGLLLGPLILGWLGQRPDLQIANLAAVGSSLLAPIVAALAFAARRTKGAIDLLSTFSADYDRAVEDAVSVESGRLAERQAAVAAAHAVALDAERELAEANVKLAEATRNVDQGSSRARLFRFIRSRVEADTYARHLSLIATVRKDFEELVVCMQAASSADSSKLKALHEANLALANELIQAARIEGGDHSLLTAQERDALLKSATPELPPKSFKRIILYIDDLDRCSPKAVVAVLEAVHLLLTFPLFVVFVAVDVRWMRGALKAHYETLLDTRANDAALALDYLEKIFQVPYWVRPLDAAGAATLLKDRMKPRPQAGRDDSQQAGDEGSNSAGASRPKTADPDAPQERLIPSGDVQPVLAQALTLTEAEQTYIARLSVTLDGSPRRALRFLNTYRVIKAGLDARQLRRLEAGDYTILLTLVAVSVGCDDLFAAFVERLRATPSEAPLHRLTEPPLPVPEDADPAEIKRMQPRLADALDLLEKTGGRTAGQLWPYLVLAGRYGFRPGGSLDLDEIRDGSPKPSTAASKARKNRARMSSVSMSSSWSEPSTSM